MLHVLPSWTMNQRRSIEIETHGPVNHLPYGPRKWMWSWLAQDSFGDRVVNVNPFELDVFVACLLLESNLAKRDLPIGPICCMCNGNESNVFIRNGMQEAAFVHKWIWILLWHFHCHLYQSQCVDLQCLLTGWRLWTSGAKRFCNIKSLLISHGSVTDPASTKRDINPSSGTDLY